MISQMDMKEQLSITDFRGKEIGYLNVSYRGQRFHSYFISGKAHVGIQKNTAYGEQQQI